MPDDVKHPRYLVCYDSGRHYSWHDTLADALARVAHGGTVYEPLAMSAAERVVAEDDELRTLRARVAELEAEARAGDFAALMEQNAALLKRIAALEAGLRPFAQGHLYADEELRHLPDIDAQAINPYDTSRGPTVGDCRRAAALLEKGT